MSLLDDSRLFVYIPLPILSDFVAKAHGLEKFA